MAVYSQSRVRMKCIYLTIALESAIKGFYLKERIQWSKCCKKSANVLKDIPLGFTPIVWPRTIMD
eukprot:3740356-Ditylum_brightwellii.AAC.1